MKRLHTMILAGIAALAIGSVLAAPSAPENTRYTVVLMNFGTNKLSVIREVQAITGRSLKYAKDLVEGAPKEVKIWISEEEATRIKKQLEGVGAKIELEDRAKSGIETLRWLRGGSLSLDTAVRALQCRQALHQ